MSRNARYSLPGPCPSQPFYARSPECTLGPGGKVCPSSWKTQVIFRQELSLYTFILLLWESFLATFQAWTKVVTTDDSLLTKHYVTRYYDAYNLIFGSNPSYRVCQEGLEEEFSWLLLVKDAVLVEGSGSMICTCDPWSLNQAQPCNLVECAKAPPQARGTATWWQGCLLFW